MSSDVIWWEKTVEYRFLLDMIRLKKLDFAAPLSGVEERAGDGVFALDSKIVLIEFKRSVADVETESKKFIKYANAAAMLGGHDAHHFLVYGAAKSEQELTLHARSYFSGVELPDPLSVFEKGVSSEEFTEYLKKFLAFKTRDERNKAGASSSSIKTVLGVSNGKGMGISLSEYIRIALPEYVRALGVGLDQTFEI